MIKRPTKLIVLVFTGLLLLSMQDVSQGGIKRSDRLKDDIRRTWKALSERKIATRIKGPYPFMVCFEKASRKHSIPLPILLAVARGESDFNPRAKSSKGCLGIMQIQWPDTARDLGIRSRSELFDPCVNIDAGARYLSWLLDQYQNDPYLALAGYNYGPNGFDPQNIPEKARGYVAYIHRHLQHILSRPFGPGDRVLILEFASYKNASRFAEFLQQQVEGLPIDIFKSQKYTYAVYLTCKSAQLQKRHLQRLEVKTGIKPQR